MKIYNFNEYINESVKGEETVSMLVDILLKKLEPNEKAKDVVVYHTEIKYEDLVLGQYLGKIDKKIAEEIYKRPLNFYVEKKAINDDSTASFSVMKNDKYDYFIDINYDKYIKFLSNTNNSSSFSEVSLRNILIHEVKHYYEYVISGYKVFGNLNSDNHNVKQDEFEYLNSRHELSARLSQFFDEKREDIISGKINKQQIFNGLYKYILYKNKDTDNKIILTPTSQKWVIKKALAYINHYKKDDVKINIEKKITDVIKGQSIIITYDSFTDCYYVKYIGDNVTNDTFIKIIRLMDIYRYTLVISDSYKDKFETFEVSNQFKSTQEFENSEEGLFYLFSLPNNICYIREHKRKKQIKKTS